MPPAAPISTGFGDPHRMVNETDADRIQREKNRRRAEERLRIEREHHRRLHDVETLRRTAPHLGSEKAEVSEPENLEETTPMPARVTEEPPTIPPPTSEPLPQATAAPSAASAPSVARLIGKPLVTDSFRAFLALDPAERFDIQALNVLPLAPLLREDPEDPGLYALLAERSETLMDRVKREVDDPLSAGALLREFALTWYRRSPEDPTWSDVMPDRWGGIFAESKVSGGRLHPWLNLRLRALHQRSVRAGRVTSRVRRSLSRSSVAESAVSRTATQQIQAEVAQAFLDDLASHPRKHEAAFPLVRLSELAVRRQVPTVNDALAALFSSSESGPFVVLHPNRYPDCDELQIRPPSGVASGAALAFTLLTPKGARRQAPRVPASTDAAEGPAPGPEGSEEGEESPDASTVWEARAISGPVWRAILEESRREKRRLDAPPRDYRSRAPYTILRELLLGDGEVRKTFLSVKWRGRPAGLPLLTTLLQKGTITPEVATDHEYLEAELGELTQGDPQFVPEGGTWKFPGWTVTREGTHREGFHYRATPDPGGAG
jgi:hypothetical protein